MTTKKLKLLALISFAAVFSSCGNGNENIGQQSELNLFLDGFANTSPYLLGPDSTIAVCDSGVKAGVKDYVMKAVRIWLNAGKRDERLKIVDGCSGTRVIKLRKDPNTVRYYGVAEPMRGNIHVLGVPDRWANHWTANHEVGHIFGFAHIFNGTTSIMNSENNGQYMNNGQLAAYDLKEVDRLLKNQLFSKANAAWAQGGTSTSSSSSSSTSANKDLYMALDEDTVQSVVYVSVATTVTSVAICESKTVDQCTSGLDQATMLSSYASRNSRSLFKTASKVSLSSGKTLSILGLDSNKKVISSTYVRLDAAN